MFDDALLGSDLQNGSAAISTLRKPVSRASTRVLVVLHQEQSTPGRVGRLLREKGYTLDIRRPRFGDALPKTLGAHAGAIIFGGPMSCNDDDDWIKREIDWIGVALQEAKPFLGLCLGAQMLARHLGHRVAPHPDGKVEVGYYPIRPTWEGRKTWPDFPRKVYQWHREGFDVPRGATLLAEGDDFAAQAFRIGRHAYGLQFHPEVTYQMICRWTVGGGDRLAMPGAIPRERHFRDWFNHDTAVARWLDGFLSRWIEKRGDPQPALRPMQAQPFHA